MRFTRYFLSTAFDGQGWVWRNETLRQLITGWLLAVVALLLIPLWPLNMTFIVDLNRPIQTLALKLGEGIVGTSAPHVVQLEFDSLAWEHAGKPIVTPRSAIVQMLEFAKAGNPRAVIVDIDISTDTPDSDDNELERLLAAWGRDETSPVLVFSRRPELRYFDTGSLSGVPYLKPTQYDAVVDESALIYWASASFIESGDGVIRRFPLWECVRRDGGDVISLPNAAIVVAQHVEQQDLGRSFQCDRTLAPGEEQQAPLNQLLHYQFSDKERYGQRGDSPALTDDGLPIITTIGLCAIAPLRCGASNRSLPSDDIVEGAILVIGTTHPLAADIHMTPFGRMHGSLVLANASRALTQFGLLWEPNVWRQVLFVTLLTMLIHTIYVLLRRVRHQAAEGRRGNLIRFLLNPLFIKWFCAVSAWTVTVFILMIRFDWADMASVVVPAYVASFYFAYSDIKQLGT